MRLIGSKLEKEITERLKQSNYQIFNFEENNILIKALYKIKPHLKNAYILDWLPEQGEDIFKIITDDKDIIEIEILRSEQKVKDSYKIYNLHEYKKTLRGKEANLTLLIASDLVNKEG